MIKSTIGSPPAPVPNPSVVLREEFDDWAVLYNPDTATAVGVNPTGVAVWKLLDGVRTPEAVASSVADSFSGASLEQASADVQEFIAELTRQGFVGYAPGATA
jgi:SynChlorMet cassette protein ScmD